MNFEQRLGGKQTGDNEWQYQLAVELNGGFGGTNGGVLAAICVNSARTASGHRQPVGLDARFIRGFRPGTARVVAIELNRGRTLSTISIDIFDAAGKLTTRGTVSLVDPEALSAVDSEDVAYPEGALKSYGDGKIWREPPGQPIPLIETFKPRFLGKNLSGIATGVDVIWDEGNSLEEACCIAADISVGPPVASAMAGKPVPIPNPDLSLRFTTSGDLPAWLLSTCRLESINTGLATTRLEVRNGQKLLAVGISTTTCLKPA